MRRCLRGPLPASARRCLSTVEESVAPKRPRGRPRKISVAVPAAPAAVTIPAGVWSWVPPEGAGVQSVGALQREDDEVIAVVKNKLLTAEEIKDALIRLGGEDVVVVPLLEKLDTITELVIASGRSMRQIRKMSDVVVRALKARGLTQAMGATGAEGERDDDWLLVDCYNCVVHLMLPATRAELDLERHWGKLNVAQRAALYAEEAED